jgi:16S rRNA (adenine1518-N6/adenine1519-N6)-dimethyltransferase
MSAIHPKKSLGQHFLQDENIARKIVASLRGEGIREVIEIGAGKGILTKYLFKKKQYSVSALEIDKNNVELLKSIFPEYKDRIIHQDILQFNLHDKTDQYAVIGNFPYNISSQIFFWVLKNRSRISEIVCMVQKEVAERITAGPGTKTYGILSVLLQAYYNIDFLFVVSPNVFYPKPKIYSAVIRLSRNKVIQLDCDEELFFQVVKSCFSQRRKMIRNSIRKLYSGNLPDHEIMQRRPEQLEIQQFVEMTKALQAFM